MFGDTTRAGIVIIVAAIIIMGATIMAAARTITGRIVATGRIRRRIATITRKAYR